LLLCFAFLALLGRPLPAQADAAPDGPVVARVAYRDREALQALADGGYDIWHVDQASRTAVVALDPAGWRRLSAAGYTLSVDRQRTAEAEAAPDTFAEGYSTVEELYALLEQVAADHPGLAEVVDYGDSWERVEEGDAPGYDLLALRLTNRAITGTVPAPGLDYRPDITITKPVFFLMAGIHARELSTHETARRFILYLTEGYGTDPDATWLLDHHEIWIVPTANPDGYKVVENSDGQPLYQRKNTNDSYDSSCPSPTNQNSFHIGVDLNRNASFRWGSGGSSSSPCTQTYRGPSAASEPEEQALEALMQGLFNDQRDEADDTNAAPLDTSGVMISLHSYSDLVLWPWGWTREDSPNFEQLAQLGRKFASYNKYTAGQASQALYLASGTTDDWSYGTLGIASYTFEIGAMPWDDSVCGGFFPRFSCQDTFWNLNRPALLYAAKSARAPYQLPFGPDALAVSLSEPTVEAGVTITLTAQVSDTNNGGQNIGAASYSIDTPDWAEGAETLPMSAADGAFDSADEAALATIDTADLAPGRHILFVRGRDAEGNWGPTSAVFLTVLPGEPAPLPLWLPLVQRTP
jgi:murein tripeptide amidase MpaA